MGWTIIDKSAAESLDFSQLPFTNSSKLRHDLDGQRVVVKYLEDKPSSLDGTPDYTYEEISTILKGDDWSDNTDPR
tara:strand:+ start:13147 stop:13374 length:228 start_codon:yes stop_codon:yes gene_type:complete